MAKKIDPETGAPRTVIVDSNVQTIHQGGIQISQLNKRAVQAAEATLKTEGMTLGGVSMTVESLSDGNAAAKRDIHVEAQNIPGGSRNVERYSLHYHAASGKGDKATVTATHETFASLETAPEASRTDVISDPAIVEQVRGRMQEIAKHGKALSEKDVAAAVLMTTDLMDDGKLNGSSKLPPKMKEAIDSVSKNGGRK